MLYSFKQFIFVLLLVSSMSLPAADFTVVALFPGKAMIEVNGKRLLLKAGEEKKGFLLVSTDPFEQTALLEINGRRDTYSLGNHIGGGYASPQVSEVRVNSDYKGSFLASGQINGLSVDFLLDTGATSVAMNENLANRLKLDFVKENQKAMVATAAGLKEAYRVTLNEVSLGGISLHNVPGLVLKGNNPQVTLLGMSFLGQLEIEHKANLMVLRKKF